MQTFEFLIKNNSFSLIMTTTLLLTPSRVRYIPILYLNQYISTLVITNFKSSFCILRSIRMRLYQIDFGNYSADIWKQSLNTTGSDC